MTPPPSASKHPAPAYVVVTGDSDGLGNAVCQALLRSDRDVRVLGLSRRPDHEVAGAAQLRAAEAQRYARVRVDLSDPDAVRDALAQVIALVRDAGGQIRSLVLANGTGFLDTQVRERPELHALMEQLNLHTPLSLAKGLAQAPDVFGTRGQVFYFSGLVTHPSVTDPLLTQHAALKKQAVAELSRLRPGRFTSVMPGAYMTPMLRGVITRPDSLLEWYAVPVGDPYARGGLSCAVAKLAVRDNESLPDSLIRPRINKLLVETQSPEKLLQSLPGAIVRCARAVLRQTGQTDAEHDDRVRYLKDGRLYGDDFPYDAILSDRLWPGWASRAYAWLLGAFALTR